MSMEEAIARLARLDGMEVAVGIQGEVATGEADLPELVEIATSHEYGIGVPMRAFMRASARIHGKSWIKRLRGFVRQWRRRDPAMGVTLRRVGLKAVADVQATIRDHDWVPNSPSTIARKGSDKPLIDSGQMLQSIRSAVKLPGRPSELLG